MVMVEALACGTPVVATPRVPPRRSSTTASPGSCAASDAGLTLAALRRRPRPRGLPRRRRSASRRSAWWPTTSRSTSGRRAGGTPTTARSRRAAPAAWTPGWLRRRVPRVAAGITLVLGAASRSATRAATSAAASRASSSATRASARAWCSRSTAAARAARWHRHEPFDGVFVGRAVDRSLLVFRDPGSGGGCAPTCAAQPHRTAARSGAPGGGHRPRRPLRGEGGPSAATGEPVRGSIAAGSRSATPRARMRPWCAPPQPRPSPTAPCAGMLELDPAASGRRAWSWPPSAAATRSCPRHRCGVAPASTPPQRRAASWRASLPTLKTDVPGLAEPSTGPVDDLGRAAHLRPRPPRRPVVAAGAPWFMTLFGRDSLLTSLDGAARRPAAGAGDAAGRWPGCRARAVDPATEEQPGRILHEVRYGAARRWPWPTATSTTARSTPPRCSSMLVHELWRWGVPIDELRRCCPPSTPPWTGWPAPATPTATATRVPARSTDAACVNQGWKDSCDAISSPTAASPSRPIALSEVQGYAYAAWLGGAALADAAGDATVAARPADPRRGARRPFDRDFWLPDRGRFALALDGDKRPVDALASNMGHCLWTGIVDPEKARRRALAGRRPELASGWGCAPWPRRWPATTRSATTTGSVWPHDTAIAVAGLAPRRLLRRGPRAGQRPAAPPRRPPTAGSPSSSPG